ncbi:MAG: Ig domain-containing protein [Verrucomicrobiota bacterium]|jgi:hypothetical protein
MRQIIKNLSWLVILTVGMPNVWAYSLLGPVGNGGDSWQLNIIGYNPLTLSAAPPFLIDPLAVGPKNLGEEYRRNTPVMYYAADANFLDYFGSNGVVAIQQAVGVFNALTNVDSYSTGLTELSLNTMGLNYQAQGLELYDLKSLTMFLMMEQSGLADAVRYTWVIHNRNPDPPAPCPTMYYLIVQRNYDITASPLNQVQYSDYVNGELYTYTIDENCGAPGVSPPDADTLIIATDPLYNNPPVASGIGVDALYEGQFYTGLTRDDVAGLRYLISTNNDLVESPAPGALLEQTSTSESLLATTNLSALLTSAQTNDAATLATLFPGVVVASSSNYFVYVTNITVTSYYTLPIGSPEAPPELVLVTNYSRGFAERYVTTFANVVITTNFFGSSSYTTNTKGFLQTITIGPQNGAPIGSPSVTNVSSQPITLTNVPSGDYYVIPAGGCGFTFPNPPLSIPIVTQYTNLITSAYTTNTSGQLYGYSESVVTVVTNHIFVVYPCTFVTPTANLYQGIGRMQFVQADYDSLLGRFFEPITNTYTMVMVTNSQPVTHTFQRVVATPDFLFTAADLGASAPVPVPELFSRNVNFDQANIGVGLAGPGTINPTTTITYNKIGTSYINLGPYYLNGPLAYTVPNWIWASFDGSTNDPVVYPDGTSLANLASDVLIQIFPSSLPNGTNGVAYSTVDLTATGGQAPYTWAVASGSALPPGLTLSSNGVISGTPAQSGFYVVTVQMTDAAGRAVAMNYEITIN